MVIFCVGNQGEGKSEFCYQFVKKSNKPCLYFSNKNKDSIINIDTIKKHVYIFDDAQSYLQFNVHNYLTRHVKGLISERRWSETIFIFCFHSFNQVPSWLFHYHNRLVIFRNTVYSKFDNINIIIDRVNRMPKHSYIII